MNLDISQRQHENRVALGIFTKSDATPVNKGFQRVHDYLLQDQSAKLLPHERVCNCLKRRIDKDKKRTVMYNESREKAHWANVQRCGSIWSCPVCAKQITEKRREELKKACDIWRKRGGSLRLLTLTNPHSAGDYLKGMIYAQKYAIKRFFTNRLGRDSLDRLGRKYQIRSFEVTYGQNGWHPHFHILLFCDDRELSLSDESEIYNDLLRHWKRCCVQSGLPEPNEHGLDIRDGNYADKYVSKWGLENELTKGHIKKGRNNSFTPFDLLQLSFDDDLTYNDKLPSKLFQEFALSFKGQRQLVWSKGMKKDFQIDEKTDEELAEETENLSITLCTVESIVFKLLQKYQLRHEYLRWLEEDFKNGTFGNGIADANIEKLILFEIESLEDYEINSLKYHGALS